MVVVVMMVLAVMELVWCLFPSDCIHKWIVAIFSNHIRQDAPASIDKPIAHL